MRNILVHGYAQVDGSIVWSAATRGVPERLGERQRLYQCQ